VFKDEVSDFYSNPINKCWWYRTNDGQWWRLYFIFTSNTIATISTSAIQRWQWTQNGRREHVFVNLETYILPHVNGLSCLKMMAAIVDGWKRVGTRISTTGTTTKSRTRPESDINIDHVSREVSEKLVIVVIRLFRWKGRKEHSLKRGRRMRSRKSTRLKSVSKILSVTSKAKWHSQRNSRLHLVENDQTKASKEQTMTLHIAPHVKFMTFQSALKAADDDDEDEEVMMMMRRRGDYEWGESTGLPTVPQVRLEWWNFGKGVSEWPNLLPGSTFQYWWDARGWHESVKFRRREIWG